MKKRWFSFVMVLAVCLSLLPTAAFAEGGQEQAHDCSGYTSVSAEDTLRTEVGKATASNPISVKLGADITLTSEALKITAGTVNLCLDGCALTQTAAASVIEITEGATLNLYDCKGTGTVTGGSANKGGGVNNKGTFNLRGGIISGNQASSAGGGIFNKGSITMSGGTIQDNSVTSTNGNGGGVNNDGGTFAMSSGAIQNNRTGTSGNGGGVYVGAGTFEMSGGKIENNQADLSGGGVYVSHHFQDLGHFTMSGGTISGNSVPRSGNNRGGGGVYLENQGGIFSLSGASTITGNLETVGQSANNVWLDGEKTITLAGSLTGSVGVTVEVWPNKESTVAIATGTGAGSCAAKFSPDREGYEVKSTDADTLAVKQIPPHKHETTNGEKTFEPVTSAEELTGAINGASNNTDACFYLANDITLSETLQIPADKKIHLCLNGKTLRKDGGSVIVIDEGGSLDLYDCQENTGKITGGNTNSGGGVYNLGTFNMHGGTITGNRATTGGGVCSADSFTMDGGVITGNTVTGEGGGVSHWSGTFQLSGTPQIYGNTKNGAANNAQLRGSNFITITGALLEGADIGVTVQTWPSKEGAVTIATGTGVGSCAAKFSPDREGYEVMSTDADTLAVKQIPPHKHETTNGEKTFEPVTSAEELTGAINGASNNTDACFYLANDITLSETLQIPARKKIHLCLNGYDLIQTGACSVIEIDKRGSLDLYDCKDSDPHGTRYVDLSGSEPVFKTAPAPEGTPTFTGGCIRGAGSGCSGVKIGAQGGSAGIFTMHGGNIAGNGGDNGVNINNGVFDMRGGSVVGNMGVGVVHILNDVFKLSGSPRIIGNQNTNVDMWSSDTLRISGALTADAKIDVEMWNEDSGAVVAVGDDYTLKPADANAFTYQGGAYLVFKHGTDNKLVLTQIPAAPAAGVGYTIDYSAETIAITNGYEVSSSTDFSSTLTSGAGIMAGTPYYVRVKATSMAPAGGYTTFTVSRGATPSGQTINYSAETITGVSALLQYQLGGTGTWEDCTSETLSLTDLIPSSGTKSITFRTKAAGDMFASAAGEPITIPARPAAPSVTANYSTEQFGGTSTAMEYQVGGGGWTSCGGTTLAFPGSWDGTTAVTVKFRVSATGSAFAGAEKTVTLTERGAAPAQSDAFTIDYEHETITVNAGYEVNAAEGFDGASISDGGVTSYLNTAIYFRRAATSGTPASQTGEYTVPARPEAPSVTVGGSYGADGSHQDKVTFTVTPADAHYQYRVDGGNWQSSNVFDNLSPDSHTFQLRTKAVEGSSFATEAVSSSAQSFTRLTGSGTLSLDGWTFGENANEPSVTGPTNTSAAAEIKYYTDEDCSAETTAALGAAGNGLVPTYAGTYWVQATWAETAVYEASSAKTSFTIEEAGCTVTEEPAVQAELTYTGGALELITAGSVTNGTLEYAVTRTESAPAPETGWDSAVPADTDAGDYWVWYRVVGDTNYQDRAAAKLGKVTIAQADQTELTVTGLPTQSSELEYGDSFTLTVSGGNGTGAYSWTSTGPVSLTHADTAAVTVTITGTGAFTVTAARAADANHKAAALEKSATAAARAITITAKAQTVTYGTDITESVDQVTVSPDSLVGTDQLTGITLTASSDQVAAIGKTITPSAAVIKANSGTGDNVTAKYAISFATGNLTINKADIIGSITQSGTLTYNGADQTAAVSSTLASQKSQAITVLYGTEAGTYTSSTVPAFTNADTYTVYYEATAPNHSEKTGHFTVAIGQLAITVQAEDQEIVYGTEISSEASDVKTVSGPSLAAGDAFTAAVLTTTNKTVTNAGSITVSSVTIKDGGTDVTANYIITRNNAGKLTITPKPLAAADIVAPTEEALTKIYDEDTTCSLTQVQVKTDSLIEEDRAAGVTITGTAAYAHAEVDTGITVTFAPSDISNSNYELDETSLIFNNGKITQADQDALTMTALPAETSELEYGDSFDLTVSGGSGTGAYSWTGTGPVSLAHADTATVTVTITGTGAFTVTVAKAADTNYKAETLEKGATAVTRSISITAKAQTVTYGTDIAKAVDQVTIVGSGLVSGDELTGITMTAGSNQVTVENKKITPSAAVIKTDGGTGADVTAKYQLTYAVGDLTINPKSIANGQSDITVTKTNTLTYNGLEQTQTVKIEAVAPDEDITAFCTVTDNQKTAANQGTDTYTLTITAKDNTNYTGSRTETFTIAKQPVTITAKAQEVTFRTAITQGVEQVDVSAEGLVNNEILTAIMLTASSDQVAQADKTITPSAAAIKTADGQTDTTDNYTIIYATGGLTIHKFTPTGEPVVSKRGNGGKKLSEVDITVGTLDPADGRFVWCDVNGVELNQNNQVEPNQLYTWKYIPADTGNYADTRTGIVNLYQVIYPEPDNTGAITPSAPAAPEQPETPDLEPGETTTKTKPDGTKVEASKDEAGNVTVTETRKDGTVIQAEEKVNGDKTVTETRKDGTVIRAEEKANGDKTVTESRKDGTVIQAEEKANGDKSVIETRKNGVSVQSEEKANGDKTITETKPDGSSVRNTEKANGDKITTTRDSMGASVSEGTKADGTITRAETNADGKTKAEATVSEKAVKQAQKEKTPVELPLPPVEVEKDPDRASEVKIQLRTDHAEVKISIPLEKPTAGTVAVIVKPDGTEEVLPKSVVDEKGLTLEVSNGATVKIVDNSKTFKDVQPVNHWASEAVDFVSSREIFNGTGEDTFDPNFSTSRGMITQVLYNLESQPGYQIQNGFSDVADNTWYTDAVNWAAENEVINGYSDGNFGPEDMITREQLAAMLYRYAGEPGHEADSSQAFDDVGMISQYAREAMDWAVENGIIKGIGKNLMNPKGLATRAESATMIRRFCELMAK